MNYLAIPLLVALLYLVRLSAKNRLQHKFKSLGDLSGKNKEYVTSVLGKPNSEAILINGSRLLQWHRNGYHISLIFDKEGNFVRISNQNRQSQTSK